MSALVPAPSPVKEADRLAFTVAMAVLLHMVIILGIGFEHVLSKPPKLPDLEVIFIQNPKSQQMKEADYLAQASQEGGGNTAEKVRPTSPPPSELPSDNPDDGPAQQVELLPTMKEREVKDQVLDIRDDQARRKRVQDDPDQAQAEHQPLSAEQLIQRSRQIASLSSELDRKWQTYAKLPRQKYISASTREYTAAAYMTAWQEKVERIGNINYPEAARRDDIYGSLLLDVALRPDGSIDSVRVVKSSGRQVLDDAAVRIVRLAAPYAPFPEDLRKDTDILHIIRTWQFERGGIFTR